VKPVFLFGVFFLLFSPAHLPAEETLTPEKVLEKIEAKQKDLTDLQADVIQTTSTREQKDFETVTGQIILKVPGRFSIHYKEPAEQVIVSNGKSVWIYTPELKQVVEQNVRPENREYILLQPGQSVKFIRENYSVVLAGNETVDARDCWILKLTPKNSGPETSTLCIWMDVRDCVPVKTAASDASGTTVTSLFKNIRTNKGVGDKLFEFNVPDGVEVINDVPPDAEEK